LRKLRDQQAGRDTDRHEHQIARPKRPKVDADDDGPTYVNEDSNTTLSKEEYQALLAAEGSAAISATITAPKPLEVTSTQDEPAAMKEGEPAQKSQEIVEIGKNQKKRRAARMIVADDESEPSPLPAAKEPKKVKKAKAIKLSFDAE